MISFTFEKYKMESEEVSLEHDNTHSCRINRDHQNRKVREGGSIKEELMGFT